MNTWPFNLQTIRDFLNNHLSKISADTLGWLAAIVLHCATVPSLLYTSLLTPVFSATSPSRLTLRTSCAWSLVILAPQGLEVVLGQSP